MASASLARQSGLPNSPGDGNGYPDLTAQMAQEEFARSLALRDLQVMSEVFVETGLFVGKLRARSIRPPAIGPRKTTLGPSQARLPSCWKSCWGIEPCAHEMTLRWTPPSGHQVGVRNYPLGKATVSLEQIPLTGTKNRYVIKATTPLRIELRSGVDRHAEFIDVSANHPVTVTTEG